MYANIQQHAARAESAQYQALAAQKRRAALCKRRAGLPFRVGVAFALVDLTGARAARLQALPLPG